MEGEPLPDFKPITAWSASRLSKYEKCPAQFKYAIIDKLPEPKHPNAQRGTDVHEDMADVMRGKLTLDKVRHAPKHIMDWAPTVADLRTNAPIVEEKWAFTKGMGREQNYFGPNVWYRVSLDVGSWWMDDSFSAVDWKTGSRYASNDDQMEQQALAVFARFPAVREIETVLAYLDTGEVERAEFQRAQYRALRDKWFARVAPMFADQIYAPRPNKFCKSCHFRKSNGGPCPFS